MRRKLFIFTSLVSLLLYVASVVMWVRSKWIHDEIGRVSEHSAVSIISLRGRIQVETVSTDRPAFVSSWNWIRSPIEGYDEIQDRFSWKFGGFWFFQFDGFSAGGLGANSFTASGRTFVMPDWFLIGLFALLPLWALRSIRLRGLKNHCRSCGYNLTGNTSGICPECGTAVAGEA